MRVIHVDKLDPIIRFTRIPCHINKGRRSKYHPKKVSALQEGGCAGKLCKLTMAAMLSHLYVQFENTSRGSTPYR